MTRPTLAHRLREDTRALLRRDPATRSGVDAVFHSPGLHAIWAYDVAHVLWLNDRRFAARQLSHMARAATGIEIHPAARIGRRLVIDHGMGVVIGETAEIGDDVLLYQGVTLGGTTLEQTKRHPTLEDSVMVGAGASILGPVIVGAGAKIGAGAIVVRDVPAGATVVGVTGRILERPGAAADASATTGDRETQMIEALARRVAELESRLDDAELSVPPTGAWVHSDGGGI